ncbi:MAG: ECF-type sigma factor [Myxococcota bacterium]
MSRFPTTAWTQILGAQSTEERDALLRELLSVYWQPLYVFARRKGMEEQAALDSVQSFCAHLLGRGLDPELSPHQGKLRSYLRTAFARFLTDEWRRNRAEKRGGDQVFETLDPSRFALDADALHTLSPEEVYELAFTERSLRIAFERLREEFEAGKWKGPLAAFEASLETHARPSHEELARTYEMTPGQLRAFLFRVRRRFRELTAEVQMGIRHVPPPSA